MSRTLLVYPRCPMGHGSCIISTNPRKAVCKVAIAHDRPKRAFLGKHVMKGSIISGLRNERRVRLWKGFAD
jgi:hypothetical protein